MALSDYDDDFPTATATRGDTLDLSRLADGEYEFAVKEMVVKENTAAGDIVKLKLELITDGPHFGATVERDYFLNKKDGGILVKNPDQIALLKKDLKTLGFDTDNWTKANSRPFGVELKRSAACIKGVAFKGKKKQGGAKNGGGYWQNLYVNERSGTDGKPAAFGVKELDDANVDPFG